MLNLAMDPATVSYQTYDFTSTKFYITKNLVNLVNYILSFGWFPGVWILCTDVSEHSVCSIFIVGINRKNNRVYILGLRFLWPCIVSKVWERERRHQQDATITCLLSTFVSTCFGHHYAHLQEIKDRVTALGVLCWFCWMWLVAVVGRWVVGFEHCITSPY